jgi:hypothetical protein
MFVEAGLAGFWAGLFFDFVAVLAAAALSGFFGRTAVLASKGASGLILEMALSFLVAALATSLSEVDSFDFVLLSLYGAGASLAEESRLSIATGRALGAGLGGSFFDIMFVFRVESSFTSPSSSSSEL